MQGAILNFIPMTDKKTIADILNNLITINKYRIVGYKEAIYDTNENDAEARRLFKGMMEQSEDFKEELKEKLKQLNEEVTDKTLTSGLIYNTWMDIVYADVEEKPEVTHFCDQIEDTTMKAYQAALIKIENLDKTIYDLILRQKKELTNSCEQIKHIQKNN
jgi:uncharacterized protein (TIGR02284 family)